MITWYQVPTQNSVSNTLWIIVALKGMTNRSSKHRKKLEFKKFQGICDSVFHSFYESDIIIEKKSASVLSKEDKNML